MFRTGDAGEEGEMKKWAVLALFLFCCVGTMAQVSVRGTEAAQVKEYGSPMTLEIPLAGLFAAPEGKVWVAEDLSGYVCKGVLIKKLVLKWKARDDGGFVVHGDVEFANTGEDDMKTTAKYALLLAGKPLASESDEDFSTEEGSIRYRRLKLTVRGAAENRKDAVLTIVLSIIKD